MVWSKYLLAIAILASTISFAGSPSIAPMCSDFQIQTGACGGVSNDGNGVSVNVEETYVGDPGPSDSYDGGGSGDDYSPDDSWVDGGGSGDDTSGGGGPPPFILTALTEIPRFCSSKFPTLGRSAA